MIDHQQPSENGECTTRSNPLHDSFGCAMHGVRLTRRERNNPAVVL
jgi:hypothetical protein